MPTFFEHCSAVPPSCRREVSKHFFVCSRGFLFAHFVYSRSVRPFQQKQLHQVMLFIASSREQCCHTVLRASNTLMEGGHRGARAGTDALCRRH